MVNGLAVKKYYTLSSILFRTWSHLVILLNGTLGELVLRLLEVEDWRQKSNSERSQKSVWKPKLLLNTGSDFCSAFLSFESVGRRPAKSKLR